MIIYQKGDFKLVDYKLCGSNTEEFRYVDICRNNLHSEYGIDAKIFERFVTNVIPKSDPNYDDIRQCFCYKKNRIVGMIIYRYFPNISYVLIDYVTGLATDRYLLIDTIVSYYLSCNFNMTIDIKDSQRYKKYLIHGTKLSTSYVGSVSDIKQRLSDISTDRYHSYLLKNHTQYKNSTKLMTTDFDIMYESYRFDFEKILYPRDTKHASDIMDRAYRIWVVLYDDKVIGYYELIKSYVIFYIKPEFRGQGLGTIIYKLIIQTAEHLGNDIIIHRAHTTNHRSEMIAKKLYSNKNISFEYNILQRHK